MEDFHFTLKRLYLQFRSQNLSAYFTNDIGPVCMHINISYKPYNIMTVVSFEVEKRDVKYIENPMLTNSNTQKTV